MKSEYVLMKDYHGTECAQVCLLCVHEGAAGSSHAHQTLMHADEVTFNHTQCPYSIPLCICNFSTLEAQLMISPFINSPHKCSNKYIKFRISILP